MSQTPAKAEIIVLEARRVARRGDDLGSIRPGSVLGTPAGPSAGTLDLALERPANPDLPEARRSPWWRDTLAVALALSLLAHASLMAWMLWQTSAPTLAPGAGGRELETVSVELVSAAALESLSLSPSAGAAGSANPVAASPGVDDSPPQIEIAAVAPTPKSEPLIQPDAPPPPPPPDIAAKPDAAPDAILVASEAPPANLDEPEPSQEIEPEPRKETPEKAVEPKPETRVDQPATTSVAAQPAIVPGGATARAETENVAADGAAGASSGELARYALEVRLALGRARPLHGGAKGRVLISFALTETGFVRLAEIARSSGSHKVDEAAIMAVRTAVFPPPPADSTDRQRSYTVPFEFK